MCYAKSIPKLIRENPSEIVDIIKYRAKHHITIPFDDGLNEPVTCNLGMSKIAFEPNLQKVSGLYLFRVNQDGLYKIGLSKDIVQRHGQHEGTYKQIMY